MKCVLLCIVLGLPIVLGSQKCINQDNCESDECCLKLPWGDRCTKRRDVGQICSQKSIKAPFGKDVYIGFCPCLNRLKCAKEEEGGIIQKFIYKCREGEQTGEPDEEPTEQPDIEELDIE